MEPWDAGTIERVSPPPLPSRNILQAIPTLSFLSVYSPHGRVTDDLQGIFPSPATFLGTFTLHEKRAVVPAPIRWNTQMLPQFERSLTRRTSWLGALSWVPAGTPIV